MLSLKEWLWAIIQFGIILLILLFILLQNPNGSNGILVTIYVVSFIEGALIINFIYQIVKQLRGKK